MVPESDPPPLADRIQKAKREAGLLPEEDIPSSYGRGLSSGLELAVAVIACAGLGLGLDRWLETKPWFMLLGLLVGLVAGMWNLYRASLGAGQLSVGVRKTDE